MEDTLAILLAGGAGERLYPLTRDTAKPAVPFGGSYRIIDFTLSNCVNSGIRRVFCLTQYKSLELTRHLREGWGFLSSELGEFIEPLPPMKRVHGDWYLGTADAVYQNIESILSERPRRVLILSGDQIYKMNYHEMLDWHRRHKAQTTIATIQAPSQQAPNFGVADIESSNYAVKGFAEKPCEESAARSPFNHDMVSVSMGIYLFETQTLLEALSEDASQPGSNHDFGRDVIPWLISHRRVVAYDFRDLNAKTVRYWRDVGTIDAYYEANMDLVRVNPDFNLYDLSWPLRTRMPQAPPAKFVFAQEGRRMGMATDSMVSPGVIISGARVSRSVLSPGVRVNSYSEIESSILLPDAVVGRYCRLNRVILAPGTQVPEGTTIGLDHDHDRSMGYTVTDGGVVVVAAETANLVAV